MNWRWNMLWQHYQMGVLKIGKIEVFPLNDGI
jgi:hypothetical protein